MAAGQERTPNRTLVTTETLKVSLHTHHLLVDEMGHEGHGREAHIFVFALVAALELNDQPLENKFADLGKLQK